MKTKIHTRTTGTGEFNIETDTRVGVVAACRIALSFRSSATHYMIKAEEDGSTSLILGWSEQPKFTPLLYPIRDAEAMADVILNWLSESDGYGQPEYDGDGHNEKGLQLTNYSPSRTNDFYYVIVARPFWIYYGK